MRVFGKPCIVTSFCIWKKRGLSIPHLSLIRLSDGPSNGVQFSEFLTTSTQTSGTDHTLVGRKAIWEEAVLFIRKAAWEDPVPIGRKAVLAERLYERIPYCLVERLHVRIPYCLPERRLGATWTLENQKM